MVNQPRPAAGKLPGMIMKEILHNLALIHLIQLCKDNGIPPNGRNGEGTYCVKVGRGFGYSLVSMSDDTPLASVRFYKAASPTYTIHNPHLNHH